MLGPLPGCPSLRLEVPSTAHLAPTWSEYSENVPCWDARLCWSSGHLSWVREVCLSFFKSFSHFDFLILTGSIQGFHRSWCMGSLSLGCRRLMLGFLCIGRCQNHVCCLIGWHMRFHSSPYVGSQALISPVPDSLCTRSYKTTWFWQVLVLRQPDVRLPICWAGIGDWFGCEAQLLVGFLLVIQDPPATASKIHLGSSSLSQKSHVLPFTCGRAGCAIVEREN